MRHRWWHDLSDTLQRIRTLTEQTSTRLEHEEQTGAQEILEWLNGEVLRLLLELKKRLEALIADDIVLLMLSPLVLLSDEIILTRLPARLNRTWPLLQKVVLERDDGGQLFYRRLEELLLDARCPKEVLQVYYYCLKAGFQGRYAGDPPGHAEIVERLRLRLPTAPSLLSDPIEGLPQPRVIRRFPWLYYAIALMVAFFLWPFAKWASNQAPWAGLLQAGGSSAAHFITSERASSEAVGTTQQEAQDGGRP